ncbi:MAG: hypothetical protein AB9866_03310 [Syntrophobacteraceae bacterium]
MLDDLIMEAQNIAKSYSFISTLADLDRTDHAVRLRLIIDETMFIQVSLLQKCSELYGQFLSDGLQWIIFAARSHSKIVTKRIHINFTF